MTKKKVSPIDPAQAKQFLESLRFRGQESSDPVEVDGKMVTRSYRVFDFFEERQGEEDDDHPLFTGRQKVKDIVQAAIPDELKGCDIDVEDQEKSWFSVTLYLK